MRAKAYVDAVKEKIAYELRIAREIQMGILSPDVAAAADDTGLEAHAILLPAQEVGGDLYEVLRTADGNIVAVTGDVSGKGIPAALFMAVTMTLVRAMAATSSRPEDILRRVSDALALHNPRCMFVTLLCAIYDPRTGRLDYASAGHPPPVLIRGGTAQFLPLKPGMVAGVMAGLSAPSQSVQLQPGDLVVFYTDGVTEAFDPAENLYGEAKLLDGTGRQVRSDHGRSRQRAVAQRAAHAGEREQSDDITVLALKRKQ